MTDTLRSCFEKTCSTGKNRDPKTHASPSENIQKFNLNISRQVIIFHHIDRSHCLFLANLLHLDYTALYKKSQWWNHRKLFFYWQSYNLPPHQHGTSLFVLTIPRILTYYFFFYKSISDTPLPPKHDIIPGIRPVQSIPFQSSPIAWFKKILGTLTGIIKHQYFHPLNLIYLLCSP